MLSVLQTILCWIKQFGALMLGALIDAFNFTLGGLVALGNLAIANWPIGMPSMPSMPSGMVTALGWIRWGPFPMEALFTFVTFCIVVWGAWVIGAPILRWLKVVD